MSKCPAHPTPLPSHLAAPEVPVRLCDLLVRVHDEGTLVRLGLGFGLGLGLGLGLG